MYYGSIGDVLKCVRGSSALEAFHRHLIAALPGFAYGAELFDAVISEYIFRSNSRATARMTQTHPISVSEVCAFERLHEVCKNQGVSVPHAVAGDHTPLPLNNGESFGLEDLGYWARQAVEQDDELEEVDLIERNNAAMESNGVWNHPPDISAGNDWSVAPLARKFVVAENGSTVDALDSCLPEILEKVEAKDRELLKRPLDMLRGSLLTNETFLEAINGGFRVRKPGTVQEYSVLARACSKEERERIATSSRRTPRWEVVTFNYNEIIRDENARLMLTRNRSSLGLSYSTPKQIRCVIKSLQDNKVSEDMANVAQTKQGHMTAKRVRRTLSYAPSPPDVIWPPVKDVSDVLPTPIERNPSALERPDPGTYHGAQIPQKDRLVAGTAAVSIDGSSVFQDIEVGGDRLTSKKRRHRRVKVALCRACLHIEGKEVMMKGYWKLCKNRTAYKESNNN